METFIRAYDNALDVVLCQQIIDLFEASAEKRVGTTAAGVVQPNKRSTDLYYRMEDPVWKQIDETLRTVAYNNIRLYFKELERHFRTVTRVFTDTGFCVRKYEAQSGGFDEHSDVGGVSTATRALAFMYYLNDVHAGGETEFIEQKIKIVPKAGRMAVFPANWTHLHRANAPVSGPKYIINSFLLLGGD